MRVAFVSLRTPEHAETGTTRRLRRTARLLADRGHEVTVFCAQWWDDDDVERILEDVRYYAVTTEATARRSFASVLPFLLFAYDPDVVHAGYAPPEQVLAAKLGALAARTPLVVDWYGDEDASGRLGDLAAGAPDLLVTPSRLVETWLRERGVDGDATRVVPESLDMSLVRNVSPRGDAEIVYARDLDEGANLESLLLALAELRERDWRCLVVGDGPARDRYEQQAADLRIDDRVEFVGDLPLDERLARYRAAHVFVQTAHRACFATELLWAMACGCVGVVEYQARSSAHELIEHRERGLRTHNDQELTEAIVAASEMEEMDLDETFAEYDHAAVLDDVLACYDELRERYGLF